MKKRIIIGLMLFSIALFSITYYSIYKQKKKEDLLSSSIAIMVYDIASKDYVKTIGIPKGDYTLNKERSKCKSGGIIDSYNSETGTVTYRLSMGDTCNLYFEMKPIITNISEASSGDYKTTITMNGDGNNIVKYKYTVNEFYAESSDSYEGETFTNYFAIDTSDKHCLCSMNLTVLAVDMYGNESTPVSYVINEIKTSPSWWGMCSPCFEDPDFPIEPDEPDEPL